MLQLYDVISGKTNTIDMASLERFGNMLPQSYWRLILVRCGLLGQMRSWPKISPFSISEPATTDSWIEFLLSLIEDSSTDQPKLDKLVPECISMLPIFSK